MRILFGFGDAQLFEAVRCQHFTKSVDDRVVAEGGGQMRRRHRSVTRQT